jgi:hypothetical protein
MKNPYCKSLEYDEKTFQHKVNPLSKDEIDNIRNEYNEGTAGSSIDRTDNRLKHKFSQAKKYHPEFSPRIKELIQSGKVKVYNSYEQFKNRKSHE